VHIERLPRVASHRFDNHRPERDIRHEAAVHHVDMNPVGAARIDGANLVGEIPEIRRQDRRRNDNRPRPSTIDAVPYRNLASPVYHRHLAASLTGGSAIGTKSPRRKT
jgi:hypothetical protein